MKGKKSISLFFACIIISLCIGIALGLNLDDFLGGKKVPGIPRITPIELIKVPENVIIHEEPVVDVSTKEDTINADTRYVILEKDMDTGKIVKTHTKMPEKYLGLTREQLIQQLENYEVNPPLTELERGFVGLELLTFSVNQVEVQMNYQYVKSSGSFYIVAYDNKLVVMLEDRKKVFLSTQIEVNELPYDVQQDVLLGLFIPNEESLYDFLESYTS